MLTIGAALPRAALFVNTTAEETDMGYYVKQMNNGHWYVLSTARSTLPEVPMRYQGGYLRKADAVAVMNMLLKMKR